MKTDQYMEGRVSELEEAIAQHVDKHHLGLDKEDVEQAFREHYSLIENGRKLDLLVDDYFGPPCLDIDGETSRAGGSKELNEKRWVKTEKRWAYTEKTLDTLNDRLENGGLPAKVKLTKGQIIGLLAAFSPILAASLNVLFR